MSAKDDKAALRGALTNNVYTGFGLTKPEIKAAAQDIEIIKIDDNGYNPRQEIDQEKLDELKASIAEHGIIQPILVRPLAAGAYEVVAGSRRLRAARELGLATVPGVVRDLDDLSAYRLALIENLLRDDLSVVDEARAYKALQEDLGLSVRKLVEYLGVGKGRVEEMLRLASAPPDVQEMVSGRPDSVSMVREVARLPEEQRAPIIDAIKQGATVKEVRQLSGRPDSQKPYHGDTVDHSKKPEHSRVFFREHDQVVKIINEWGSTEDLTIEERATIASYARQLSARMARLADELEK